MNGYELLVKLVQTQEETALTIAKLALVQQQIMDIQMRHTEILVGFKNKIEWLEQMEKIRDGKGYLS